MTKASTGIAAVLSVIVVAIVAGDAFTNSLWLWRRRRDRRRRD